MYYKGNYPVSFLYQNDRQFLFPFLLGGLAGGAIAGASRPRPVYAYNISPATNFNPNMPYGSYSYSYYYPNYPY